jgi:hypothetical protein
MPEAAMHEQYFSATPEDEIGTTRERSHVKAISVAELVDESSDGDFGLGVFAANARHAFAALAL